MRTCSERRTAIILAHLEMKRGIPVPGAITCWTLNTESEEHRHGDVYEYERVVQNHRTGGAEAGTRHVTLETIPKNEVLIISRLIRTHDEFFPTMLVCVSDGFAHK